MLAGAGFVKMSSFWPEMEPKSGTAPYRMYILQLHDGANTSMIQWCATGDHKLCTLPSILSNKTLVLRVKGQDEIRPAVFHVQNQARYTVV